MNVKEKLNKLLNNKDVMLAKKIKKTGGQLYVVGGAVRNTILNKEVKDVDLLVTGITEKTLKRIVPETIKVGKDFPVYLYNNKEIAFARKEKKSGKGYKGFDIETENISLEEDLKRRDFTCNAIAYNVIKNEIIDPFCGLEDIKRNLLVHISEAFGEDPLRVYRAARFSAEYGFKLHFTTFHEMELLKDELVYISPERVFEEFKKAINSNNPSLFFDTLIKCNVLDVHFPEISKLLCVPQVKKWHPEGNVYNHTMMALDVITQLTDLEHVRFAVLCHDLGKGLTDKTNWPHHYDHDHIGLDTLNSLSARIPLPNKWLDSAIWAITQHHRITKWKIMKPGKVVNLFEKIKRSSLNIRDIVNIVLADKYGRGSRNDLDLMKGIEKLYNKMFAEVTGKLVNSDRYKGKEFGEQLFQLRSHFIKKNR